jgi:sec-independent protein translocase protein TatA
MINEEILLAVMPGGWEMVVIALVILLMFGAKKLPELARGLGQGIREFKGAVDGVKDELKDAEEKIEKKDETDNNSNN